MEEMKIRVRRLPLAVAAMWAMVWLIVAVAYRINEPTGELSVTYGGHTYAGNPPAVTLFERDGVWVLIMMAIVAIAILISVLEVNIRRRRRFVGRGVASVIVGALLMAFSLFGLLWGLASFGVVGLLLHTASRPIVPAASL
jgi:hypothetical protein